MSISAARSSPATAAATAAATSEGRKSRQCVPAPRQEQCQLDAGRSLLISQLCLKIPCLLTSGYAQDELCGSQDGAPAGRVAAVEPVEEVVDVREGSDRLHPPFERAEDQELHPLDRLRLEHVPCVPDLTDGDRIISISDQDDKACSKIRWPQRDTIGGRSTETCGVCIRIALFSLSHLQVERRGNVGLLHLGSQGQARHGQQLRHPGLVFLKWRETHDHHLLLQWNTGIHCARVC